MTFKTRLTALTLATALAAGGALAKDHGQNADARNDGVPGANTGAETAGPAQTLGKAKGNDGKNIGKERGNSANAGRSTD